MSQPSAGRRVRVVRVRTSCARPRTERSTDGRDHDHRRRPGGTDRRRRLRGGRRGRRRPRGARDPRRPGPHDRGALARPRGPARLLRRRAALALARRARPGRSRSRPSRCARSAGSGSTAAGGSGGRHRRACSRCSPTGAAARRWTSTSTRGPPRCTARRRRGPPRTCSGSSPTTADPGRLSAAFVWDLLLRVTAARAPAVRWPRRRLAGRGRPARGAGPGAGGADRDVVAGRRAARAAGDRRDPAGVRAGPARRRHAGLGERPVRAARRGPRARPPRRVLVADLDDAGFVERVTGVDATLAPAGHCAGAGRHAAQAGGAARRGARPPGAPARPRAPAVARPGRLAARRGRRRPLRRPGPAGSTWRDRPAVDRGRRGVPGR